MRDVDGETHPLLGIPEPGGRKVRSICFRVEEELTVGIRKVYVDDENRREWADVIQEQI